MLRVSVLQASQATVYKLEGALAGPWVQEFRALWFNRSNPYGDTREFVDLNDVDRIDADGMHLLTVMHLAGVRFIASAPYTRSLLEEMNGSVLEGLPESCDPRLRGGIGKGIARAWTTLLGPALARAT